jgi:hypothetical protein
MSPTVQIVLIIVAMYAVYIAWLRVPRWFSRSLARHALWRLRDDAVDSVIDGRLPAPHPAVREFVRDLEFSVRDSGTWTIRDFYVWSWMRRRLSDPPPPRRLLASTEGLTESQAMLLREYASRWLALTALSLLYGSWLGILTVVIRIPSAVVLLIRQKRRDPCDSGPRPEDTLRVASDMAVADSWMGRNSREFVGQQTGPHLSGVA